MGEATLSKSLIQFSIDGQSSFDLGQTMVELMKIIFLQKIPCRHCCTQCPQPCSRPLLTQASTRDSWILMGKSRSVSCGVTAPFSWVLVHTWFCFALQEFAFLVLWKFCNQIPLASKVRFPTGSQSLWQIPRLGTLFWALELNNVRISLV